MFGIIFSLLGLGALTVDSIKGEMDRLDAYDMAKRTGKPYYTDIRGRHWVNNERCFLDLTPEGHDVVRSYKDHRIVYDITQAYIDERNKKPLYNFEVAWEEAIKKAEDEGKAFFIVSCFYYKTEKYRTNDKRSGRYEMSTKKKIYTETDPITGKHYKYYYGTNEKNMSIIDYRSKMEISEEEWKSLAGYGFDFCEKY